MDKKIILFHANPYLPGVGPTRIELTGRAVGYAFMEDGFMKVWADKRTVLVQKANVISIDMQD